MAMGCGARWRVRVGQRGASSSFISSAVVPMAVTDWRRRGLGGQSGSSVERPGRCAAQADHGSSNQQELAAISTKSGAKAEAWLLASRWCEELSWAELRSGSESARLRLSLCVSLAPLTQPRRLDAPLRRLAAPGPIARPAARRSTHSAMQVDMLTQLLVVAYRSCTKWQPASQPCMSWALLRTRPWVHVVCVLLFSFAAL